MNRANSQDANDELSVDEELQVAAGSALRLVSQCRVHVERSNKGMGDRLSHAAAGTPGRVDMDRARKDIYFIAFKHSVERIEAMNNALLSHLKGLQFLLSSNTFYPLPAMAITRSIAEVASSVVWGLRQDLSADDRTARSFASLFLMFEKAIAASREAEQKRTRALREELVRQVQALHPEFEIIRRVKKGKEQEDVAQVRVGKARAKTLFQYSQRLKEEIPIAGALYSQMSAATHGHHTAVSASFDTPASYARAIGFITLESTKSWSSTTHAWLGMTPGQFWNDGDLKELKNSIPLAQRLEFEGGHRGTSP